MRKIKVVSFDAEGTLVTLGFSQPVRSSWPTRERSLRFNWPLTRVKVRTPLAGNPIGQSAWRCQRHICITQA